MGVYVSYNLGATWSKLGLGLPGAPVVSLQLDTSLQVLVAAVQGRGVFELSTQTSGPTLAALSPGTPINTALAQITVTFNDAVDPRTFTVGANTAARTDLAASLLGGPTYANDEVISLYQQYLRRTPTENISAADTTFEQAGEQQVIADLVSSAEYFNNPALGAGSNATWVNQVYIDLLHRSSAGDAGAASDVAALNAGQVTRLQIAEGLVKSTEFLADQVAILYNQILGRNKSVPASMTDPDVANWVPQLQAGTSFQVLIADLLGSQEYYVNNGGVYPVGAGSSPTAVALADLNGATNANGTPILDLIVADSGTNTVAIYQGQTGGGYGSTPTLTLTLPTGASPTGIAVGNFTSSSLPDIAVADAGTASVTVFLNTSTGGGFSFASLSGTSYSTGTGSAPAAIVAGNIAGSGNTDLAVVSSKAVGGNYNLDILQGTGTGTFGNLTTVNTGFTVSPTDLAVGDVNGDGIADFVVSASDSAGTTGGLNLLLGTAPLTYKVMPLTTIAATSVALASLDSSGKLDIAATIPSTNSVMVLQNQGGTPVVFGTPAQFPAGSSPTAIATADLNDDGSNDIVVVNSGSTGGLTTLINTTVPATSGSATISFATAVTYPVAGANPVALVLGDTTQNLTTDAVLATESNNAVDVLLGTADGTFQGPTDQHYVTALFNRLFAATPPAAAMSNNLAYLSQREQSVLTGPGGQTVPLSITDVNTNTNETFQLNFAPQTNDGTYTLAVGPNALGNDIDDFVDTNGTYNGSAQPMNQNGNLANGEYPADRYSGLLAVNTSDDGEFIAGLYQNLLGLAPSASTPGGRVPDTVGFVNALAPIDAARFAELTTVAPTFTTSNEYRSDIVQSYFVTYLRRTPSAAEVQSYVTLLNQGKITEEGIIGSFVSSSEYFTNPALGNSSDATWLQQVYSDLLNESPASDPNSAGYLSALTAGTMTLGQVASKLIGSSAILDKVIFADFANLLGRAPAAGEYANFLPILEQTSFRAGGPSPDEQLIDDLVSSQEYFVHVGNTNQSWSASMYTKLLHRSGSASELNTLTVGILNGYAAVRQNVSAGLLGSTEHKNRVVATYYQSYLGRAASAAEVSGWVSQMPPLSDSQVLANIVSSGEYYPLTGPGSSNSGWLSKIYAAFLNRAPDSGSAGFLAQLNAASPAMTGPVRTAVALEILRSTEYYQVLVTSFFSMYLGRTPSTRKSSRT